MKNQIISAIVGLAVLGGAAPSFAYEQTGPEPSQVEYQQQFHRMWEEGVKIAKDHNKNLTTNYTASGKTRGSIMSTYGNEYAYYVVYKGMNQAYAKQMVKSSMDHDLDGYNIGGFESIDSKKLSTFVDKVGADKKAHFESFKNGDSYLSAATNKVNS